MYSLRNGRAQRNSVVGSSPLRACSSYKKQTEQHILAIGMGEECCYSVLLVKIRKL